MREAHIIKSISYYKWETRDDTPPESSFEKDRVVTS